MDVLRIFKFSYYNEKGEKVLETCREYLTSREICKIFKIKNKNGSLPTKKMKIFLDNYLKVPSYYYHPTGSSNKFNRIKVYDVYDYKFKKVFYDKWVEYLEKRDKNQRKVLS